MAKHDNINSLGERKVSPSYILNLYYPMPDIDPVVLAKAGARGNLIHNLIENYYTKVAETPKETFNKHNNDLFDKIYEEFDEKDQLKIDNMWHNFNLVKDNLGIHPDGVFESYISDLEMIHGYVDYFDANQIIDWKTNAKIGKEEIEKYTIQLNLYRYMIWKSKGIKIDNLKIVHVTSQDELTPTFKFRKHNQLVKVIDIELYKLEWCEKIIKEAYDNLNEEVDDE